MAFERTPCYPPAIAPIGEVSHRPRWSVAIPVYNAGEYLAKTIECVLAQNRSPEEMEIVVVDDCSTDIDVEELVARIGGGRVRYHKQATNVGSLRNFETAINLSRGYLIHLLHADDLIDPGFYDELDSLFNTYPEAGAAFCRYRYINSEGKKLSVPKAESEEKGILDNWLVRLGERQRIQYVCIAVRRSVYEHLGGFCIAHYGEDWEMWTRIAKHYPVAYSPRVLASYRRHENSITGNSIRTGQNIRDLERVMARIQEHLPEEKRKAILKKSRRFYSHYFSRQASQLWTDTKDSAPVLAQLRGSLRMHTDLTVLWSAFKIFAKILLKK